MTEDRDTEVSHDVPTFVAELRRLADALESGSAYTIHVDGEDVTIPEGALFSVAHEREDGEVELEFQVTWTLADDDEEEEDDEDEDEEDGDDEADDETEAEAEGDKEKLVGTEPA